MNNHSYVANKIRRFKGHNGRIILVAMTLAFLLIACGKSEIVTTTETAISAIGEVTLDSKDSIEKAEGYYNALTDKQKEQVENVAILVDARKRYDKLVEEAKAEEEARAAEEAQETAEMTEEEEIVLQYVLNYARGLKSPRSLKINDAWFRWQYTGVAVVVVSISAENSYGGTVEKTIGNVTGFVLSNDDETWADCIKLAYDYEKHFGYEAEWGEVNVSSSRTVSEGTRLDADRLQQFYDDNVYTVK